VLAGFKLNGSNTILGSLLIAFQEVSTKSWQLISIIVAQLNSFEITSAELSILFLLFCHCTLPLLRLPILLLIELLNLFSLCHRRGHIFPHAILRFAAGAVFGQTTNHSSAIPNTGEAAMAVREVEVLSPREADPLVPGSGCPYKWLTGR